jgi:hypothetical protein
MKTTKKFIELTVFAFAFILVLANTPNDRAFPLGKQSDIPTTQFSDANPSQGFSAKAVFSEPRGEDAPTNCWVGVEPQMRNNNERPRNADENTEGEITATYWILKEKWDGTWPLEEDEADILEVPDGGVGEAVVGPLETRQTVQYTVEPGSSTSSSFSFSAPCEEEFHFMVMVEGADGIDAELTGTVFVGNGDYLPNDGSAGMFSCEDGPTVEERTDDTMSVEWE